MILDPDIVEGSSEGASSWAGKLSGKLMSLRAKIKDYAEGRATLEELLEEAKVDLENEPTKEESPVTELLLDQLDELRHAISEHRRNVLASGAYDLNSMTEANKRLWGVLG